MKIASFGLSLALLFVTGCANKPDVISGTEELNPLISSSYAAADRLLTPTAKQELLRKDKRVLVASWVDVNQVSRSSIFGKMMAEQLAKVGIAGSYEGALLYAGNPELISRTHFARFLVEQGVCRDTDQVFKNYLVEHKPGYVPHQWASLDDAVAWIKAAGGVAVIAHPGRYKLTAMQLDELFKHFKELGGLAIEVVTGSHSPAQYQIYTKAAEHYGFMASRGSDFHDPQESYIDLGKLPHLPEHLTPVWSVFH